MAYADFTFYQESYGGTFFQTEEAFNPCANRASLYLDELTLGRAEANAENERVKLACCAIAEQVNIIMEAEADVARTKGMKSQSVGSFSVTFSTAEELASHAKAQIGELARLYLGSTGLLYRGVRRIWD